MPGAWLKVKITSLELGDLFLRGFAILNFVKVAKLCLGHNHTRLEFCSA
jgi:hypothetical protein